jgi:hypothetical protein
LAISYCFSLRALKKRNIKNQGNFKIFVQKCIQLTALLWRIHTWYLTTF